MSNAIDYKKFVVEFLKCAKSKKTSADLATKLGWLDINGDPETSKISQTRQYVNSKMPKNKKLPSLARATNGSGIDWDDIATEVPDATPAAK